MNSPGIVVLAAGSSSRFGKTKQLLSYNGSSLIQHVINEAVQAGLNPVMVVTGAYSKEVSNVIHQNNIQTVFNENWKQGIASGIVTGLKEITSQHPHIEKLILAVCDQPFVSAALFQQLNSEQIKTGKPVVACAYAGTVGTPVLFTKKYFDKLQMLQGDEGAKKVLKQNMGDVATVSFPQGSIDIDTPEDYHRLLDAQKHVL